MHGSILNCRRAKGGLQAQEPPAEPSASSSHTKDWRRHQWVRVHSKPGLLIPHKSDAHHRITRHGTCTLDTCCCTARARQAHSRCGKSEST
jgi:hypothetical protein